MNERPIFTDGDLVDYQYDTDQPPLRLTVTRVTARIISTTAASGARFMFRVRDQRLLGTGAGRAHLVPVAKEDA